MDETPKGRRGQFTLLEAAILAGVLAGVVYLVLLPAIREAPIQRNEEAMIEILKHAIRRLPNTVDDDVTVVEVDLGRVPSGNRAHGYSFQVYDERIPLAPGRHLAPRCHVTAAPIVPSKTGRRFFYVDDDGIIRFKLGAPASSADSPVP